MDDKLSSQLQLLDSLEKQKIQLNEKSKSLEIQQQDVLSEYKELSDHFNKLKAESLDIMQQIKKLDVNDTPENQQ